MTLFWTFLFFVVGTALYAIPFVPALREIRHRHDDSPLDVQGDYRVDVKHFATRFRARVRGAMGELLGAAPAPGIGNEGELDGERHVVLAHGDTLRGDVEGNGDDRLVLGAGDLTVSAGRVQLREVYASGALRIENGTACRALLAEGSIDLAADVVVFRWAHASQALRAETGACLHGRVTSDQEIELHEGVFFERLHAPAVRTHSAESAPEQPAPDRKDIGPKKIHPRADFKADRVLIDGDLDIPENSRIDYDLVVLGKLRVGAGTELLGRVKARHELVLGENCVAAASLVSEKDLVVGAGCSVAGPILAEGRIQIGAHCRVGSTDVLTTVRGESMLLQPGVIAHGTVWAASDGEVTA